MVRHGKAIEKYWQILKTAIHSPSGGPFGKKDATARWQVHTLPGRIAVNPAAASPISVDHFATEEPYDHLEVNCVPYSGKLLGSSCHVVRKYV